MHSENKIFAPVKMLLISALAVFSAFAVNSGDALIENCEISGNTATGKGGGIYLKTTGAQVKNCTVVNNASEDSGGGIAFELGKNPIFINMIIWENIAPSAKEILNPTAYLFNSDVQQDGFDGINGNINRNPLFINTDDYRLQLSSPVIGKGDSLRAPYYDRNGARRGSSIDMGAYEYGVDVRALYVNDADGSDAYDGLAAVYNAGTGSGPKKTIQAAINTAETGDTINAAAGTYSGTGNKNLDFKGKNIKLVGGGASSTIIDCGGGGRAFYLHNGETRDTQIKGFTIQNGSVSGFFPEGCGGAILLANASPSIKNCIIKNNTADWGGALELYDSNALLENCVIVSNTANKTGGSLYILGISNIDIVNCTIADNTEVSGEEQASVANAQTKVNIVNTITERLHIIRYSPSAVTAEYSCIKDGFTVGIGNITWGVSTILFDGADYKLNPFSPVIDAANASKAPSTDIIGNSRYDNPLAANGGAAGTPPVDMGAYEFTAGQVSGTSFTMTLATDQVSSLSYTITDLLQNTQVASGSTVSGTPDSKTLPIGVYRIDYSPYQRTVYFNASMTIYLNPNEKEIDLGEISSYKRYELRFVHYPFGISESGVAYEDETADIDISGVTLTKPDSSTRTVAFHDFNNAPVTRLEYLGSSYTPVSGILCENLSIKDASLPDNTIIFDIYHDDVSAIVLLPSGGLAGESSTTGIDTYERFNLRVNHLLAGATDNIYIKETDSAQFTAPNPEASITAGQYSGSTSRTENLSAFAGLTISTFNPSSATANEASASSANIISVDVNYNAESELLMPPQASLTSGYGGSDPSRLSEQGYDGGYIDTYKRYLFKLNYTLMGSNVFDSFYVVENDGIELHSPTETVSAYAKITREGIESTESLSNFPDTDKMQFVQFSPSNSIAANDSNATVGNVIAAAAFIAEAEVLVPPLSELTSGYGAGDPSKNGTSGYEGGYLDTYKRYNAVISYAPHSEQDSFYVGEGDEITLQKGSASVIGAYSGTHSLYNPVNLTLNGFTPASPITASDSVATSANIIPVSGDYETSAYICLPSSESLPEGYGGGDPASEGENYTGSCLDTFQRYKVNIDYNRCGELTPDIFYVIENDQVSLEEGNARINDSSDISLKTFSLSEYIVFEPSASFTASDSTANTQNEINISAKGAISEVTIALPAAGSPSGAGDPQAGQSSTDGGLYLDTRERFKVNVNYKNHAFDKTESIYAMEDDNISLNLSPLQIAATGLNPVSLTLTPFTNWTVNSFTWNGGTYTSFFQFAATASNASSANVIDVTANYSLSGTAADWTSEMLLPPSAECSEGYGAANPDTEPANSGIDTWKRFVYDLEAEPFTYHGNTAKVKLKWQKKVVVSANHEKVEQIIVRSKTGGDGTTGGLITLETFPDRVSEGQELSGNALVVHVGDLIYGGYDYVLSALPADGSTYKYRIYTRLTGSTLGTVTFMEDEVSFTTSGMQTYLDSDNDGLTDAQEELYNTSSANADSDSDGLSDYDEINVYHTDPLKADTDSDGLSDYDEINVYHTDPLKVDSDDDWLYDGEEVNTCSTNPLSTDSDNDGLTDYEEVMWFGTDPNKADSDSDGLSDLNEILTYHTDPMNADTDADGLPDSYEVNKTSTDPNNADSDDNGISDGNEDDDSDGISNADEYKAGMNPEQAAISGDAYQYDQTILEDAEDSATTGWAVTLDNGGASVANVVDPYNSSNKVIQFSETNTGSEYTFTPASAIPEGQLKIEWKMLYASDYDFCVKCTTSSGARYIHYTSATSNTLGSGESITYGLGSGGGAWKTVRRDLLADLQGAQASNTIISIDNIIVKGAGYLDDMRTMAYIDSDRDLIPDNIELALGLDPNNPSDAAWDHDADSTSNLNEFMAGTLKRSDNDRDGDGIRDADDANPDSATDSDSDGLPDDWENWYFSNLNQTAAGDPDSDGMTNIDEFRLGRHPNAAVIDDTDDSLELRVFNP